MARTILVYISLILSALFTINAYWIGLNGSTSIEMFNQLPVYISPANYVYIIWLAIFAIVILFCMTYHKNRIPLLFETSLQSALYIAIAILHIFVIYIWHIGQYMSAVVLCGALVILIFSLYNTYPIQNETLTYRIPIAIILSWQLFLFVMMVNVALVRYEWSGIGLSFSLWTVIFLTILTAISVYLRYQYDDFISPIVFIWIFIGIMIENGISNLLVSTAASFLSGVLLFALYVLKKNREAE